MARSAVLSDEAWGRLEPLLPSSDGRRGRRCGVSVGGISGVIGDPSEPLRRDEKAYTKLLSALTAQPLDVLLLHEGPAGDTVKQLGNPDVRRTLVTRAPALTICGHVHWPEPVAPLGDGHVLNVDARVLLLTS